MPSFPHPEIPLLSFLSAIAVLFPLPYHWRTGNVPVVALIFWLFVYCFTSGINSIIWAGTARISVPVWCDIVTKFHIGVNLGIPTSCLCISIQLAHISAFRHSDQRKSRKKWDRTTGFVLCWCLPFVYMAVHYVVQGHRFNIFEDYGCRATAAQTISGFIFIYVVPLVTSLLTAVYSVLALFHIYRSRSMFIRYLADFAPALTTGQYLRLLVIAIFQMFSGLLVYGLLVAKAAHDGVPPWISWASVHYHFSSIWQFPMLLLTPAEKNELKGFFWAVPAGAMVFAVTFSFSDEVLKEYRCLYRKGNGSSAFRGRFYYGFHAPREGAILSLDFGHGPSVWDSKDEESSVSWRHSHQPTPLSEEEFAVGSDSIPSYHTYNSPPISTHPPTSPPPAYIP